MNVFNVKNIQVGYEKFMRWNEANLNNALILQQNVTAQQQQKIRRSFGYYVMKLHFVVNFVVGLPLSG